MATRFLARSLLTTGRISPAAISRSYAAVPSPLSNLSHRLRPLVSIATTTAGNISLVSNTVRGFATRQTTSSLNDSNPNWSNRPPKETILLDGCDFEHWLVVMEKPEGDPTRDEIIDSYVKTLAKVVGSEEEARMKLYSVSTRCYFAFGALVSEEVSYKIKELEGVRWVLPDSYLDVKNKDYGGEPVINGVPVPYDPKYHEEWIRNNARANDRNRRNDRPRNFDRSRNFERRRENMQTSGNQGGPPPNMGGPGGPPPNNMGGPGGPPPNMRGPGGPPPNMGRPGGPPPNMGGPGGPPPNMGGPGGPPPNLGGPGGPPPNMGGPGGPPPNMGGPGGPPPNMGGPGSLPPNMGGPGGPPPNMRGPMGPPPPSNNWGGQPQGPPPGNNWGGQPQGSPNYGGGQPNNWGQPQPNYGGPPNVGGGMPPNNMGNAPNYQQQRNGPNSGGVPYQSGPGPNRDYQNSYNQNLGGGNPYQTQDMPERDMPPPGNYQ